MSKALFVGSFDPFHWGHDEVVKKILRTYDEIVIGVLLEIGIPLPLSSTA